jgi:hypothetical protein
MVLYTHLSAQWVLRCDWLAGWLVGRSDADECIECSLYVSNNIVII